MTTEEVNSQTEKNLHKKATTGLAASTLGVLMPPNEGYFTAKIAEWC